MTKDYGEIIITAMRRRGVTQQELADVLDLNHTTVSRKLEPNAKWWVHHYAKAMKYLDLDPAEVFGEGRIVGNPEKSGGSMAKVYSMVQGFKLFQRNPSQFMAHLQKLSEVESSAPHDFEKLMHDIEYLHSRLGKSSELLKEKKIV